MFSPAIVRVQLNYFWAQWCSWSLRSFYSRQKSLGHVHSPFSQAGDQKCGDVLIREIDAVPSESGLTLPDPLLLVAAAGCHWKVEPSEQEFGFRHQTDPAGSFWVKKGEVLCAELLLFALSAGSHLSTRGKSEQKRAGKEGRCRSRMVQGFSQRSQPCWGRVAAALRSLPQAWELLLQKHVLPSPPWSCSSIPGPELPKQLKPGDFPSCVLLSENKPTKLFLRKSLMSSYKINFQLIAILLQSWGFCHPSSSWHQPVL